jgi:hypothetical protein
MVKGRVPADPKEEAEGLEDLREAAEWSRRSCRGSWRSAKCRIADVSRRGSSLPLCANSGRAATVPRAAYARSNYFPTRCILLGTIGVMAAWRAAWVWLPRALRGATVPPTAANGGSPAISSASAGRAGWTESHIAKGSPSRAKVCAGCAMTDVPAPRGSTEGFVSDWCALQDSSLRSGFLDRSGPPGAAPSYGSALNGGAATQRHAGI